MEIPRHWRLKAQRYRLQGSLCRACGQPLFPLRAVCPYCMTQAAQIANNSDPALVAPIAIVEFDSRVPDRVMERLPR